MKTLTTITGEKITIVSCNQSKRTFTLRTTGGKFRTYPMSRKDFNYYSDFATGNDWQQFLRSSDYYKL